MTVNLATSQYARYHGSVEKAHGSGYYIVGECDCHSCWERESNHRLIWGNLAGFTPTYVLVRGRVELSHVNRDSFTVEAAK